MWKGNIFPNPGVGEQFKKPFYPVYFKMTQLKRSRFFIYIGLLAFLVIAYLPLSSFFFALKNDALTTNFPNKYFFSASLHAGYLPIWNPYINFGLPLYADPGFAFWNPITWIFGWIGYSVSLLTIEILFYIWLAGISAFELGTWLGHGPRVSFCMGIIYMCCGFFIGNLQHINFLTSTAFLPLVLKTYLDLQKTFTVRKLFFCLISLYLLASGGHPAIPVACIYFLVLIQAGLIIFSDRGIKKVPLLLHSLRTDFILLVCFILLAAPLLYSYYEIYPHFTRAAAVNQTAYSDTGFDLPSYLSFLYPFSTTANHHLFGNDPLMRNGYISLTGLACVLIALVRRKNQYQKIFFFAGVAMFVLSLGGPIKEFLYSFLPLLDHIRTNGEFRVFGLLSLIVAGSYKMTDLMKGRDLAIFLRLLCIIAGIGLVIIISGLIFTSAIFDMTKMNSGPFFPALKYWLQTLTFFDRLFLNSLIVVFLIGFYFLMAKRIGTGFSLLLFTMADLIIFSWTQLPITGVQLKSPASIEKYFSKVPSGIPIPQLSPIAENRLIGEDIEKLIGYWPYYSKQPGTPVLCSYPSKLNHTVEYFKSVLPDSVNKKAFVYSTNKNFEKNLTITFFSPSEIGIRVDVSDKDSLILLQNNYFRWNASVNGNPTKISKADISFMAVPLQKGVNTVNFSYHIGTMKIMVGIAFIAWFSFLIFLFVLANNKKI
jgi:hypothetical protein